MTTSEPTVLHVDAGLIVALKPAGLPAVPGRTEALQDCLFVRVQKQFPDALVVHRLDMATSGLMLFARGAASQRALGHAFEQRKVEKRYIALVHGLPQTGLEVINLPLAADWPNRPRQKVDTAHGKPALTHLQVLARDAQKNLTRLELNPVTGRTHQLRVHLHAIGHPIVGDTLYGNEQDMTGAPRLMLHAQVLTFDHPLTGAALRFEARAPF
jgi:tRNA pseudouridine32 synthase/23S rRNA pseudouridine746 synthase